MITVWGDILLCYRGRVSVFFIYYVGSLSMSVLMSERSTHAGSKPARSAVVEVCDPIFTPTRVHTPLVFLSLLCHDLSPPAAGTLHTLPPGGCCPRIDQESSRLPCWFLVPQCQRSTSVAVWREECLCVVREGLPCQHFKLCRCTNLCSYTNL